MLDQLGFASISLACLQNMLLPKLYVEGPWRRIGTVGDVITVADL